MRTIGDINHGVRNAVAARPHELALADPPNRSAVFGGDAHRLSWLELDGWIGAAAAQLNDAGVRPGDRVGIQLPNVVELPITILACLRIGAVAVPFPVQHREHELRYGLGTAEVSVMVTAPRPDRPDQLAMVAGASEDLADPPQVVAPVGVPAGGSLQVDPAATSNDTLATICWTSGTTGLPKGVPRTHSMWLASGSFQVDQLELTAEDRILCPFPVVNMAGIGGMLVPWAMVGAALHLHQPLDLEIFLGQLQSERVTYTVAPPALLNRLLGQPDMLESIDFRSIRKISSGSAPLDPWMVAGWQERGVEIVNVFGSNEGASLLSTAASVPDPAERARFFPRPDRPGVETRLVDLESGQDIDVVEQPGELRFRGATVFEGYLDSDGEEFDDLGFYRTGDLFEWVDSGGERLLRFVDRAKDIIIRGGMNVSAAEVEALVSSHPGVLECAAVAFPDRELGERVGIFVVAASSGAPGLADVVAHLRDQGVASYKLPERIELIDVLPRNPVGKVTKGELRDRWT